jgi:hypothetical protein
MRDDGAGPVGTAATAVRLLLELGALVAASNWGWTAGAAPFLGVALTDEAVLVTHDLR